jgi:hypothetical protein
MKNENRYPNFEGHVVVARGPGLWIVALTAPLPPSDWLARLIPDCRDIQFRPLRPGEAEHLAKAIPAIVR